MARNYLPDCNIEIVTNGDPLNLERLKRLFTSGLNKILTTSSWYIKLVLTFTKAFLWTKGSSVILILNINESEKYREEAKQFALAANVQPGNTKYVLAFSADSKKANHIRVVTRSLLGIMFYISQAVEVPSEDISKGKVTQTRTRDGKIFNWDKVTGDLLKIRSIPEKPQEKPQVSHC
mgnify:CR=1 FL=1